jgi:Zn-dependent protease with chaperone function
VIRRNGSRGNTVLSLVAALLLLIGVSSVDAGRARRQQASAAEKLRALQASAGLSKVFATFLGVLSGAELLLEFPALRPYWWLTVFLAGYVLRLAAAVIRSDTARSVLAGHPDAVRRVPTSREIIRKNGTMLLPQMIWVSIVVVLLAHHPSLAVSGLVYAGYLVVSGLSTSAVLRLAVPTRGPTVREERRIRAICERYRLGLDDVRLLKGSSGALTNAFVSGLWPSRSHVCLTERLLETFDDDEVGFVIAHEIAHRDRGHVARNLAARFAAAAAVWSLGATVVGVLGTASRSVGEVSILPLLVLLSVARFVLVGVCRVRFEHEADAAAARRVGAAASERALQKLSDASGVPRELSWWRAMRGGHPAVANRIERVNRQPVMVT